jgi:sugar phosphate isomerase/epimerase
VLLSTAAFFTHPIASTFRLAAECGFEGVEVMVTKEPDSQDPRRIRGLADEHGVRVGALHAPCLLVTRSVWTTDPIEKVERSIEVAADADIPVVVVHPAYRWQRRSHRWLTEDLPAMEARTEVAVAVENMFPVRIGRRGFAFHSDHDLRELEGLPHVVLDTSHAAVAHHDPIDVLRRFGRRLRHVHLSDNPGHGWDAHLPLGEGVLDIDGIVRELAASGYDGAVTLEVDLRRAAQRPGLKDLMIGMRERVEGVLRDGEAAAPRAR